MAGVIDTLSMLPPQHLSSEDIVAAWLFFGSNPDLEAPQFPHAGPLTNSEVRHEIENQLSRIPSVGPPVPALDDHSEDAAHDAYFHIQRVENNPPAVFTRTVLSARLILLKEVDEVPPDAEAPPRLIDRALADLASCLRCSPHATQYVHIWEPATSPRQAMRRWIRGHQLFAALTQGLVFSFQSMARALRAGESAEVGRWADLSVSLFRGSAAALQFTGDFSVDDYTAIVRPSMSPPASPICLSGLMSADHRHLVKAIQDMRPALKAFREQDQARHDRLCQQLGAVYDQHIFVCERFVGNKPSLLNGGRTEKPGPTVIEQFKKLRLKPFEHDQRAQRLAPGLHGKPEEKCPLNKWSD